MGTIIMVVEEVARRPGVRTIIHHRFTAIITMETIVIPAGVCFFCYSCRDLLFFYASVMTV